MRLLLLNLNFLFIFGVVIGAPGKYTSEEETGKSNAQFSSTTSIQGSIQNDHQYNKRIYESDPLSNSGTTHSTDYSSLRGTEQSRVIQPHPQAPCHPEEGCPLSGSRSIQTYGSGLNPCTSTDCPLPQTYGRRSNQLDKLDVDEPGAHIGGENTATIGTTISDDRLNFQPGYNKNIPQNTLNDVKYGTNIGYPSTNIRPNYPATTIIEEDQGYNHNPNPVHRNPPIAVVPANFYSNYPSQHPVRYIPVPATYPNGQPLNTIVPLHPSQPSHLPPSPPPPPPPPPAYIGYGGSHQYPNHYHSPNEPCDDPPNHHNHHQHHHHYNHHHSYPHEYHQIPNHRILDHHLKIGTEYKETGQHTGPYQTNHQHGYGSGYGGDYNGAYNRPIF